MKETLYLVQSSSAATLHVLNKLKQIYTRQDHVVFLGESLAVLTAADLAVFASAYCIDFEHVLLNPDLTSQMKTLNYAQFADLILQFERCISLK
ncbi:hypothetical protein [Acinetobacter ihumii]|uniref:hypothetical protein n=1 Tax=Acinetobacter ihumii TaxID=2483802 RepID=UPI001030A0CC|nr:hypothetical protein [Acinetobacter ihumii]